MTALPLLVFGSVALGCVAAAALADLRHFEIPDHWSLAVVGLFAAYAAAALPLAAWWPHAAVGAALFGIGAWLFARGWLGGGDVKLLAACGVWSGFDALPQLLGGTVACGGALALAALAGRRAAGPGATYPAFTAGGPLPYAVAILGGAVYAATTLAA